MNDTQRTNLVETIVADDCSVRYGEGAWGHKVEAITSVADTVKTTFGPYGRDKLVISNGGNAEVTSETTSILRKLHLDDPVARMVRDVANSQLFNAGDGTTATVVLTAALIEHADELVDQGLHPTTIVRGYEQAFQIATSTLPELATTYDITDRCVCERVAETVLAGTSTSFARSMLVPLSVEAVAAVTDGYDVNLNALRVRGDRGSRNDDSELLSGAIIDAVPDRMPASRINDATVLLVEGEIEPMVANRESKVSVQCSQGFQAFQQTQDELASEVIQHLTSLSVDVLVVDSVSDTTRRALHDAGITVLSALSETDHKFLIQALRTNPVGDVMTATGEDLVTANVEFNPSETYTVFTKDDAGTATLHLRSSTSKQLTEIETTIDKAIEVVTHVATDGRVLPGGCATEVALAMAIRNQATAVQGREQLATLGFADALESLPSALAHNAGLDPIDQLLSLRTAHSDGNRAAGIDVHRGEVANMWNDDILDVLPVKQEMLSNAKQAVTTIIRIDGLIEKPSTEPRS